MSGVEALDAIAARADAATEGPWRTWQDADDQERGAAVETAWAHDSEGADTELITDWCKTADAEFIAASRTDVPALVAALRAALDVVGRWDGFDILAAEVRTTITTALGGRP